MLFPKMSILNLQETTKHSLKQVYYAITILQYYNATLFCNV